MYSVIKENLSEKNISKAGGASKLVSTGCKNYKCGPDPWIKAARRMGVLRAMPHF